jgi:hypothetical protein
MSSPPTATSEEPAQLSAGIPDTSPLIRTKHATIESPRQDYVPATFNMEDEKRLVTLSAAGDLVGIQQMVDAGKVVTIEHGTECVVIDLGLLTTEVRIMEGTYKGESVFVSTEHVNRN